LAQNSILAADFIGAEELPFEETFDRAFAYFENISRFGRSIDGTGVDFFRHVLSMLFKVSKGVKLIQAIL